MSMNSIKIDGRSCAGSRHPVNFGRADMGRSGQANGGGVPAGAVLAAFAKQISWCDSLDAPFTARLLRLLSDDVAKAGPTAALIGQWPGDPVADALPLRLAGAFHALVLTGADPGLAACYPPGGDAERFAPAVQAALERRAGFLQHFLRSPPQTNEVGRSTVLLGGFLQVAAATGLPLRLLEIGASAGLNLLWDRYSYRLGSATWGDPASPVRLEPEWTGKLPPLAASVGIASRAGCDIAPLDIRQDGEALRLRAYVWPDQPERLARLDAAIALARTAGPVVERADAALWVRDQLGGAAEGQATVLFHSIMWQYMPAATQTATRETIERAGARATRTAPVAWLRFEPPRPEAKPELHSTLWPGGSTHHLATAHPHGRAVAWVA